MRCRVLLRSFGVVIESCICRSAVTSVLIVLRDLFCTHFSFVYFQSMPFDKDILIGSTQGILSFFGKFLVSVCRTSEPVLLTPPTPCPVEYIVRLHYLPRREDSASKPGLKLSLCTLHPRPSMDSHPIQIME